MEKILCVDDDGEVLGFYRQLATEKSSGRFHIDTAESGEAGLAAVQNSGPYAVIVSDMQMPGMNGIEFLCQARNMAPQSVRIMVTGYAELRVAVEAVNEGNIFRFLAKPTKPNTLAAAIDAGIAQYNLIRAEKELLERTLTGTVKAFAEVLSLVSPIAFGRATRVQRLAQQIGKELSVEQPWQLEVAALLSQLGCVTLPDAVLRKEALGSRLTREESAMLDAYPRVSHNLIQHIPRLERVAEAVAYQRKCLDEIDDYPRPCNIPLEARILKVALDFDSLETSGLSRSRALERLQERNGWYEANVLNALARAIANEIHWEAKEVGLRELFAVMEQDESCLATREIRGGPVGEIEQAMILAEDVFAEDNALLLSKGQELTCRLVERLRHFSRHVRIREPIRVLVPPKGEAKSGLPDRPIRHG